MNNGNYEFDFANYCDLKKWSENTKKNYLCALRMFENSFKGLRFKDISDKMIESYLLKITGRSNRCMHHSAIKILYKNILHCKFKMRYIPYPEHEEKLPIYVNISEFLELISVCVNNKHRTILSVMFDCGLRVGEITELKLTDIDRSNMHLIIRQGKGRKDRRVKLTKILLAILESYYYQYKPKEYLFEGQFGGKYSVRSCQKIVKIYTEKSGIKKDFSPHKFRHGYAMGLLENGSSLQEIANQMGHKSRKTTEIYARMNNTIIQKIQSPLEQIIANNSINEFKINTKINQIQL